MIIDALISTVNLIISAVGGILSVLTAILPTSPFKMDIITRMNESISQYLGGLNWLIPIPNLMTITTYWLMAIAGYYVISVAMRWVKMIE